MQEKLKRLLDDAKARGVPVRAVGGTDDLTIKKMEQDLRVNFPESYKWFLCTYGECTVAGAEIYGSYEGIDNTRQYREFGSPDYYVVIENLDEYQICLDTSDMKKGECPIVDWDMENGTGTIQYNNLFEYLYERFKDSIHSWENN